MFRWRGDCDGQVGKWFPTNYVEEVETSKGSNDAANDTVRCFSPSNLFYLLMLAHIF